MRVSIEKYKQLEEENAKLKERVAFLEKCCAESSKLEGDILRTAEPYVSENVGTYSAHHAWSLIKAKLEESERENE